MKMRLLLAAFVLALSTSVVFAQAQAPAAPAAAKAPALDEADALVIQVVQLAALRANDACASLETTKTAQSLQQQAVARFTKKYPGFDVDFSKGVLVAKAAAK